MTWDGFSRSLRSYLRGLAEGGNAPIRLILAARNPLNTLFADSQEEGMTSPLAGICIEEQLGAWDEKTVRDFINTRLQSTPVTFTEQEILDLTRESDGHPQKLTEQCHRLYAQYCVRGEVISNKGNRHLSPIDAHEQ